MVKEQFSLKGRRGIVTGASRGLGMAMAAGLAEMGADLVIAARNLEKLETVAEDLSVYGGKIIPVRTDVSVDDDLNVLVEKTCAELGGIDFVFCNAGITRRAVSHEHSVEDFDDVYRVNVRSVFILTQLAARVMIKQGHSGSIVITESILSVHGSLCVPGYSSSKGAVHMLIRTLANDWGQYNIRVNGIGPGFIETEMTERLRNQPDRYKYITSRMALKRWGKPDDFAGAAVYFASDASSYVTGTTLYIDGGFLSM